MTETMTESRIPKPLDLGRSYDFDIESIWNHYEEHLHCLKKGKPFKKTVSAERYACGFPLPEFQRPQCWTVEQKQRFIESIYLGLFIGTYTIHESNWEGPDAKPSKFSGWCIDGQQRLLSIEDYWNDKFKVFDLYYSELTPAEKRRFMRTGFKQYKVELHDEEMIKELYNRLSLGGTAHTEEQRAK